MSFHPDDYLNDLNIDLGNEYNMMNEQAKGGDLSLFSQSDFFDLDVFPNDNVMPRKQLVGNRGQSQMSSPEAASPSLSSIGTISSHQDVYDSQIKKEDVENTMRIYLDKEFTSTSGHGNINVLQSANEDKRKRNTAASARFRIKKKMKEQQMEKESKELQEKVFTLEKKLKTLEMENKLLKNLVLQKNEKKNSALLEDIKQKSIADLV